MVSIKQATNDDVETLYELILAIAEHHDQTPFVRTSPQEMLQDGFTHNPKFGAFLAYFQEEVAGYVSYTWNYSIWSGQEYMNIDDLFVWDKFRGLKIGEALMLKAKQLCESNAIKKIKWEVQKDNLRAIRFYERLGAQQNVKGVFHWHLQENAQGPKL